MDVVRAIRRSEDSAVGTGALQPGEPVECDWHLLNQRWFAPFLEYDDSREHSG